MFEFDYKETEEMSAFKVISEGEGYFKVLEAREEISKSSGNPMLVLTHELRNDKGEKTLWMQYISQNEYAAENIFRLFDAAGKAQVYQDCKGRINTNDLLGLKGKCKIKTESHEKYGDKSKVSRFIPYKPMQEDTSAPAGLAEIEDNLDDIPF